MRIETKPWDAVDFLNDEEAIRLYIEAGRGRATCRNWRGKPALRGKRCTRSRAARATRRWPQWASWRGHWGSACRWCRSRRRKATTRAQGYIYIAFL